MQWVITIHFIHQLLRCPNLRWVYFCSVSSTIHNIHHLQYNPKLPGVKIPRSKQAKSVEFIGLHHDQAANKESVSSLTIIRSSYFVP